MEKKETKMLSELCVLDLADEKGSFCTKLIADLGARVIKIEKPGGDQSRSIGPLWENSAYPESSLSFLYNNVNKLDITLDIEKSEGREIFLQLIDRYDVIVETYPPGYLKELNLGYDVLCKINPKILLISITGFGQYGPKSTYKTCDLTASAAGGHMYASGHPESSPLKIFGEQSYNTASLYAAIAILLGHRKRTQNGIGEHIDISLQESNASTLDHIMVRYFYDSVIHKRNGSLHWNNLFCILPCKDGFIRITIFEKWDTLIDLLDNEGMADDLKSEKWKDEEYRNANVDHVIKILQRWTKNHTKAELFETAQLMQFPWAPVQYPGEVIKSTQLNERDFFVDIYHPESDKFLQYPGMPYKFSSSQERNFKRAPFLGADNIEIFRDELGISEKEIKRLQSLNVF